MYFNVGRYVYLQTDVIFPYMLLAPTLVAGKITLGIMQQILSAFSEVRTSFQYLVNSWSTIVELISIYQRLRGFEARIHDEPAAVDRDSSRRLRRRSCHATKCVFTAPSSPWSRAG